MVSWQLQNCFVGAKKRLKLIFLFNDLPRFPENVGSLSDEQGERFHYDIQEIETWYLHS